MSKRQSERTSRRARGLVVTTPGGRAGWLARRLFPVFATRMYLAWIRATRSRQTREYIERFNAARPTPCFDHVEIETINRCNGDCAFCPVSKRHEVRPFLEMSEALFAAILEQLSDLGYGGSLGLFSNNEPLLDNRLERFAAAARDALPGAFLCLSTNGRLLDVDLLCRLLPKFDRIVVNNYNDSPVMHGNIGVLHEFCRSAEGARLLEGRTLEIVLRCSRDILTTRAGTAPNRIPPSKPLALPCALPFSQLIVRPDGKVSLCCNDALGGMTLGDLSVQSAGEVWFGPAFADVRRRMLEAGRAGIALCRGCDFVKHEL